MVAAVDTGLDFFRQVLSLRGYRQELLSADIANASTPGFKAVDLDFAGALAAAGGRTPNALARVWLVDDPRHIAGSAAGTTANSPASSFVKYQAGTEVTLDGNSVDLNQEKTLAAENAVHYEAAATFTSLTIRMLMTAIGGSAPPQGNGG